MEQLIINAIKNYGIEKAMGMFAKEDVDEAVESMTGGGFGNSFINKFTGGQGLTGLLKNQGKKFIGNQAFKALTGGSGSGSGIAGALPLFAAALGLGYMTNPLREGSYNYNPNLQGQINYASGRGYIGNNPSSGLMQYGPSSILSGQNVVSGFGTNDYGKQLQNYKDKYGDTMSQERLDQLNKEIEDLTTNDFDEVDKFIETQTTTNNNGGGNNNYGSSGKVDTGGFEQDGTGRQGYGSGGIASLWQR